MGFCVEVGVPFLADSSELFVEDEVVRGRASRGVERYGYFGIPCLLYLIELVGDGVYLDLGQREIESEVVD